MTAARLPHFKLAPQATAALLDLSKAVGDTTLEKALLHLVYLRVSQLNGCAYCVDMHGRDLLKAGDDVQRMNSVATWHEVDFFTPREEAALAWAESLTDLGKTHASDEEFEALRPHFSDSEIAHLTYAIAAINAWNRIAISMRMPVARQPSLL
jgi:AhpD family alkylhydroperoxidase